jgi:RNA polymerase sigma-70 factor (ECF subfamily)
MLNISFATPHIVTVMQSSQISASQYQDAPELISDESLIEQVQFARPEALLLLFERHAILVYSIALRILQSSTEAEDVLHHLYLDIWHNPLDFKHRFGGLQDWLTTTARNQAIELIHARRPSASIPMFHATPLDSNLELDTPDKDDAAHDPYLEHRQMLDLAYFDGWTAAQIAEKTEQPIATVKRNILRALRTPRSIPSPVQQNSLHA